MANRRSLSFDRFDEIMPDVERLLGGHETVGNWSFAQICNHLAASLDGSIDGFGIKAPWLVRKLFGPVILRTILAKGRMRAGIKVPDWCLPEPDLDAPREAEALRAAIRRFADHSGPLAPHPIFERMTRDDWEGLHLIHIAHHLSFVLPAVHEAAA